MSPAKTPKQKSFEVTNVGPVEYVEIPLIPGVVVIRGRCGRGKTKTLEAIDTAGMGSKHKLSTRDGSVSKGKVTGEGVTLTIDRSTRRWASLRCRALPAATTWPPTSSPRATTHLKARHRADQGHASYRRSSRTWNCSWPSAWTAIASGSIRAVRRTS